MLDKQKTYDENSKIENLKIGYKLLENDLSSQFDRLKNADEKLNMLLVFNAAILALLTIIFPINELSSLKFILFIVFLAFFIASMVATLILIIISIFPCSVPRMKTSNYVNEEFYRCSTIDFLKKVMKENKRTLEGLHIASERKYKFAKPVMILTVVNIGLMIILIGINII